MVRFLGGFVLAIFSGFVASQLIFILDPLILAICVFSFLIFTLTLGSY